MMVLVCEENARMQQLIVARLAAVGAQVVGCADAASSLSWYRELRPRWVVLGLELDGAAGLQATRRLLEIDAGARIVLMSAAEPDEEIRGAASRAGARECLSKDDLDGLVKLVMH